MDKSSPLGHINEIYSGHMHKTGNYCTFPINHISQSNFVKYKNNI